MQNREQRLTEFAEKYKTDKIGHGYLPWLAKYIPESPILMMEIGVWHGYSARMFKDFYPDTDIYLMDLYIEGSFKPRHARNLGMVPLMGSQVDFTFLESIKAQFDFIEEDGSHNSYDQIASFKHLFLHNMRQGGLWVTEDLHCCTDPFYWSKMEEIKSVDDTMLGLAKKFIETGKIVNPFFNEGESEVFESLIARMELCADDKLLFVWRK